MIYIYETDQGGASPKRPSGWRVCLLTRLRPRGVWRSLRSETSPCCCVSVCMTRPPAGVITPSAGRSGISAALTDRRRTNPLKCYSLPLLLKVVLLWMTQLWTCLESVGRRAENEYIINVGSHLANAVLTAFIVCFFQDMKCRVWCILHMFLWKVNIRTSVFLNESFSFSYPRHSSDFDVKQSSWTGYKDVSDLASSLEVSWRSALLREGICHWERLIGKCGREADRLWIPDVVVTVQAFTCDVYIFNIVEGSLTYKLHIFKLRISIFKCIICIPMYLWDFSCADWRHVWLHCRFNWLHFSWHIIFHFFLLID